MEIKKDSLVFSLLKKGVPDYRVMEMMNITQGQLDSFKKKMRGEVQVSADDVNDFDKHLTTRMMRVVKALDIKRWADFSKITKSQILSVENVSHETANSLISYLRLRGIDIK